MLSLCSTGVGLNNFSKTTRPREKLYFLLDTLSIEDEKIFKACKSVFLLRYNSLPCGTECFTGCREAQTTNAREKQACSWFGLIGCRDVITSCVSASFSLVAAILDALLSFQSCFLLYLWIYCLSFVHNSAFPLFSSIESYTQFSALPVLYFVSF